MGKQQDAVETGAELICPYCELPIETIKTVTRELTARSFFGTRVQVMAYACTRCHKLLGFLHTS